MNTTKSRDINAFRHPKLSEKGTKTSIDKKYFDTTIWIQIEDALLFKQIFPSYLHHIADEIESWYIFVKRTYRLLNSVSELKLKKEELYTKYEKEIEKIAFKNNITLDYISSITYFDFVDLLKKFKIIKD